jgi:hypothetical protein
MRVKVKVVPVLFFKHDAMNEDVRENEDTFIASPILTSALVGFG